MSNFEIPARQSIKIDVEEGGEWIVFRQDDASVAIHKKDLPNVIDYLCDIAGVGSSKTA